MGRHEQLTTAPTSPPPPQQQLRKRVRAGPSPVIALIATLLTGSLVLGTHGLSLDDPVARQATHDSLEFVTQASILLALAERCPNPFSPARMEQDIRDLARFSDDLVVAFKWEEDDTKVRITVTSDIGFTSTATVQAATLSELAVPLLELCEVMM